jgi:hypothetical protein
MGNIVAITNTTVLCTGTLGKVDIQLFLINLQESLYLQESSSCLVLAFFLYMESLVKQKILMSQMCQSFSLRFVVSVSYFLTFIFFIL